MSACDCHGCAFRIESQTVPQAHVFLGGVQAGESSFLKENKMMAVTTGVQHIGLAVWPYQNLKKARRSSPEYWAGRK